MPLNATAPTMGRLEPPHHPKDGTPRIEVALSIDADRQLTADVTDLRTGRTLLRDHAVVRLL